MTNRKLALIVKDQKPIVLPEATTLRDASQKMWEASVGSVLVVDPGGRLVGIFTGRDAVRALARGSDAASVTLADAMTRDPVTIAPDQRAVDALRMMSDGGFRHLPIVADGQIKGIVSRGDFKGPEIDRLDIEQHLWETLM